MLEQFFRKDTRSIGQNFVHMVDIAEKHEHVMLSLPLALLTAIKSTIHGLI